MLESWNLAHKSSITYHDDSWCLQWPPPPSIQSGTINVLHLRTSRIGCTWHTSIHARELKFGTQVENHILWCSMMSRITPSFKYPVRIHQHPPSMTLRTEGSWHTSFHARKLKFVTQVNNHIYWPSMMSRMTPSSKHPVRNHQRPPNMTLRMGGSWHNYINARSWNLAHKSES